MLSSKAKYGLRAMVTLARARGDGPLLVADIAARDGIPPKFLGLILLDLKKQGLVQSKKGRGGGYALSRPPDQVSVSQIVRILDGPLALTPCVSQTAYVRCEECLDEATCGVRFVLREVRDATALIMDRTTLGQLAVRVARAERRQGSPAKRRGYRTTGGLQADKSS
ncbi:MAG TPA: Rrf2 family transcriptional regulator [bacterium]